MIYCSVVVVVVVVNGGGFQCQLNAFVGSSGPSPISLPPADTTTPFRSGRGSWRYCSWGRDFNATVEVIRMPQLCLAKVGQSYGIDGKEDYIILSTALCIDSFIHRISK